MNRDIGPARMDAALRCATSDRQTRCAECPGRTMSLCSRLDGAGLERLAAIASTMEFHRGDVIFEQAETLQHVFLITEGIIKLYRALPNGNRQILGFLGPGDVLGGIKLGTAAYSTAQAITKSRVCAFDRPAFLRLLNTRSDLCFTMLITATDEIEAHNDQIILIARKRVTERLASFLLTLASRWRTDGRSDIRVELPMSRADIADHLGSTVESISRTFTRLRKSGLIETPAHDSVVLRNLPALYEAAGVEEVPMRRASLGL